MNTVTNYNTGKQVNLHYVAALPVGYGHKRITVEIEYENEYYEVSATTSHMPGYDAANDLEGEEKQLALYELVESKIEDQIAEFIQSVDEQ